MGATVVLARLAVLGALALTVEGFNAMSGGDLYLASLSHLAQVAPPEGSGGGFTPPPTGGTGGGSFAPPESGSGGAFLPPPPGGGFQPQGGTSGGDSSSGSQPGNNSFGAPSGNSQFGQPPNGGFPPQSSGQSGAFPGQSSQGFSPQGKQSNFPGRDRGVGGQPPRSQNSQGSPSQFREQFGAPSDGAKREDFGPPPGQQNRRMPSPPGQETQQFQRQGGSGQFNPFGGNRNEQSKPEIPDGFRAAPGRGGQGSGGSQGRFDGQGGSQSGPGSQQFQDGSPSGFGGDEFGEGESDEDFEAREAEQIARELPRIKREYDGFRNSFGRLQKALTTKAAKSAGITLQGIIPEIQEALGDVASAIEDQDVDGARDALQLFHQGGLNPDMLTRAVTETSGIKTQIGRLEKKRKYRDSPLLPELKSLLNEAIAALNENGDTEGAFEILNEIRQGLNSIQQTGSRR